MIDILSHLQLGDEAFGHVYKVVGHVPRFCKYEKVSLKSFVVTNQMVKTMNMLHTNYTIWLYAATYVE